MLADTIAWHLEQKIWKKYPLIIEQWKIYLEGEVVNNFSACFIIYIPHYRNYFQYSEITPQIEFRHQKEKLVWDQYL